MAEQDQEQQEFSLEDILKEFGSGEPAETPEEPPETEEIAEGPTEEAPPEVPEETIRVELSTGEKPPVEPVGGDTIRLDDVASQIGDTQRLDAQQLHQLSQDTAEESEAGSGEPEPEEEPEQEPFAPGWEPEYEQPMGEYVPPEPIVFRPRSRLHELKRKLVAGPEKRYYDLTEMGLGKLQAAIFLNLIVVLLSAGALVLYSLDMVAPTRMRLLVYSQVLAMLISAMLGSHRLIDGIGDLLHKRFTLNSMLCVTFVVCALDGVLGLKEKKVPFCAAFCLEKTMALWAEYQRRNTETGQMDTMRKATRLDSVVKTAAFYQSRPGFLRGQGEVEDFMDHYSTPSGPEKTMRVYALVSTLVSLVIGVAGGVVHKEVAYGVHSAAAAMLAAVPVTAFIALSRPAAILEKRLHRLGTVICGWRGVLGMSGPATIPLSDEDIFPAGSVKMNGVKFYSDRDPDQVVAYGTALITAEGGGLTPIFEQLLDSRNGRHYDVENLRSYNSGGLGGEVCGEPVLVGVLPFMREMGVDMPEGTRVNQAVYVAIDGELCGVFAITYAKTRSSAAGLTTLCGYRNLTPVLTSRDFMLTESFLRSKFGINTRRMEFPDRAVRYELTTHEPEEEAVALALTTQDGLAPAAFAITGARALRTASRLGVGIHMAAGILGLLIVTLLSILGYQELLSPTNLLLFELVWMIPGLLITEWTRSV